MKKWISIQNNFLASCQNSLLYRSYDGTLLIISFTVKYSFASSGGVQFGSRGFILWLGIATSTSNVLAMRKGNVSQELFTYFQRHFIKNGCCEAIGFFKGPMAQGSIKELDWDWRKRDDTDTHLILLCALVGDRRLLYAMQITHICIANVVYNIQREAIFILI